VSSGLSQPAIVFHSLSPVREVAAAARVYGCSAPETRSTTGSTSHSLPDSRVGLGSDQAQHVRPLTVAKIAQWSSQRVTGLSPRCATIRRISADYSLPAADAHPRVEARRLSIRRRADFSRCRTPVRSARTMCCLWVMNTTTHGSGVSRSLPLLRWPGPISGPESWPTLGVWHHAIR